MSLVRYNPWREMSHLQRQLNSLFDDALIPENWSDFSNLSKIPAAELTENDEAFNLKLEVGEKLGLVSPDATSKKLWFLIPFLALNDKKYKS